jgi:chitinase
MPGQAYIYTVLHLSLQTTHKIKLLLAAITLSLVTATCTGQAVIAYYEGDGLDLSQYPVGQLTHIVFSFCHLKKGLLSVDESEDSAAIRQLVGLKKANPALKVILSLGGWGGCRNCSLTFATPAGREAFARSVLAATNYFHTDGIDIDWEYPSIPGYPGHPYKPEDKAHFTALMQALRNTLGPSMEISFAAGAFTTALEETVDWQKVMPLVTHAGLMTYDFVSEENSITGHQTALYSTPQQQESVDHAVRYLDSLGVPLSKLVIGAAFYAREFRGVRDQHHGLYQRGKNRHSIPFKQIHQLLQQPNSGYTTYWDDKAAAVYSYNASRKIFLTYDDERSVTLKAAYVKEKKLAGIMFWELNQDLSTGGLIDCIVKTLH